MRNLYTICVAAVVPEFRWDTIMAAIVDFPTLVQDALRDYGDLLPNEPQRRHFAEYLTGLFVADRKNISGINREFAQTTDQSCLNRFATEASGTPSKSTNADSTSCNRILPLALLRTKVSSRLTTP